MQNGERLKVLLLDTTLDATKSQSGLIRKTVDDANI